MADHKNVMTTTPESRSTELLTTQFTPYSDEPFNPKKHGAVLVDRKTQTIAGWKMPTHYSTNQKVLPLTLRFPSNVSDAHPMELATLYGGGTGRENEYHLVDSNGEPADALDVLKDLKEEQPKGFNSTDELWRTMLEIGTDGRVDSTNEQELRKVGQTLISLAVRAANSAGKLVYPGSTVPAAKLSIDQDANPAPFVQKMINDVLGKETLEGATFAGVQDHAETIHSRHALLGVFLSEAARTAFAAMMHSSPADAGQIEFDIHNFRVAKQRTMNDPVARAIISSKRVSSVRRMQQEYGIGTGGSIRHIPPIEAFYDDQAYLRHLDSQSRHELVSRTLSPHGTRHRPDIGTTENTHADTGGYRAERVHAHGELVIRMITATEWLAAQPEGKQQEYFRQYPEIFPAQPFDGREAVERFVEKSYHNGLRTAVYPRGGLLVPMGEDREVRRITTHEMQNAAVRFMHAIGMQISKMTLKELQLSQQTLSKEATFDDYYKIGKGNFSDYFVLHVMRRRNQNIKLGDALREAVVTSSQALQKAVLSQYEK